MAFDGKNPLSRREVRFMAWFPSDDQLKRAGEPLVVYEFDENGHWLYALDMKGNLWKKMPFRWERVDQYDGR